jgi:hypothetical protein
MSDAPAESEEVQKIRYSIKFPNSLIKGDEDLFITIYQEIYRKIEVIITNNKAGRIISKPNPSKPNPDGKIKNDIFFEVDKEYKYFFLSQLMLLKMKYIEYGMFFFEIKPKPK